jgi:hypothetical protein
VEYVPCSDPVDVAGDGLSRVRTCEFRDEGREKYAAGWGTLQLWDFFLVAVDMEGEEARTIGFSSAIFPCLRHHIQDALEI